MSSEAALFISQLKVAVPVKRARVEKEEKSKDELDQVRKTLTRTEEDRDMWRKQFEDWNKKQGEEIECLKQEYKERSERLRIAKTERPLQAGSISRGQSPMEFLTPREL